MVLASFVNWIMYGVMLYQTRSYAKEHPAHHKWSYYYSNLMRILPLPFIWESCWRSWLPSLYNERQTIIPSLWNSIFIARMFATLGEVCWGLQVRRPRSCLGARAPRQRTDASFRRWASHSASSLGMFPTAAPPGWRLGCARSSLCLEGACQSSPSRGSASAGLE